MPPTKLVLILRRDPGSALMSFVGVFDESVTKSAEMRRLYPAPQYFYAIPLASCLLTQDGFDWGQHDQPHQLY